MQVNQVVLSGDCSKAKGDQYLTVVFEGKFEQILIKPFTDIDVLAAQFHELSRKLKSHSNQNHPA